MEILIVEDEAITALDLKKTLEKCGHKIAAIVKNYSEAMAVLDRQLVDLALIDIKLRNSSGDGIQIAKYISEGVNIPFIFLTSNSDEFTFKLAKELRPAAYLLKPFKHQELAFQVELAFEHYKINESNVHPSTAESVYFPTGGGHKKINKSDVVYLKAEGNFTFLHLKDGTKVGVTGNLGYYLQFFPSSNFFQIHRSYLINTNYINKIESETIYLNNTSVNFPISLSRKNEFLKRLAIIKTK